jgi:hypothetical protein
VLKEGLPERQLAAMDKDNSAKNQTMPEDSIFRRFFKGFSKPTGYKPALILLMLFTFQQFSGIYITIFYAVTFFQVSSYWYFNMLFALPQHSILP